MSHWNKLLKILKKEEYKTTPPFVKGRFPLEKSTLSKENNKNIRRYLMNNIIKTCLKILCIISISSVLTTTFNSYLLSLPTPVKGFESNPIIEEIKADLIKLNVPQAKIQKIAEATYVAYKSTGINPKLILALMKTESNFKEDAIGPVNRTKIRYKGLLQTPSASYFPDVDILHGARILEQKLKVTNNDLLHALALYKGGNNKVAHKQAKEVIILYQKLQN